MGNAVDRRLELCDTLELFGLDVNAVVSILVLWATLIQTQKKGPQIFEEQEEAFGSECIT